MFESKNFDLDRIPQLPTNVASTFTETELKEIVGRATFLVERLNCAVNLPQPVENDYKILQTRLQRWCQALGYENLEHLEKRLRWDGMDMNTAQRALSGYPQYEPNDLPQWAHTLQEALRDISSDGVSLQSLLLHTTKPFPFQELALPFICVARRRIYRQSGANYSTLSEDAHRALELSLLGDLTFALGQSAQLEFSIFRRRHRSRLDLLLCSSAEGSGTSLYRKFIAFMLGGGLKTFLQEYSVLARLLSTLTDEFVDTTTEFIRRLNTDLPLLQDMLRASENLGTVTKVDTGLGDRHTSGRTVLGLMFSSGVSVIYKPRSLAPEIAWANLLGWLQQKEVKVDFLATKAIDLGTHGWMEFVKWTPCSDENEVQRYYWRAGGLLALVHALAGIDIHLGNIIACGEYPVLIDLETLMHEQIANIDPKFHYDDPVQRRLAQSVLRTWMLPKLLSYSSGQTYDVSALGGNGNEETQFEVINWCNINTDNMELTFRKGRTEVSKNRVVVLGKTVHLIDYLKEFVCGFRDISNLLLIHSNAFINDSGPLGKLSKDEFRFILRSTANYHLLIQRTLAPESLRDGVDFGIVLESLIAPFLDADNPPAAWSLIQQEQNAIAGMAIPRFSAALGVEFWFDGSGGQPAQKPGMPLLASIRNQFFKKIDPGELEREIDIIHAVCYCAAPNQTQSTQATNTKLHSIVVEADTETRRPKDTKNFPRLSSLAGATWYKQIELESPSDQLMPTSAIAVAESVAEDLARRAIRGDDGSVGWFAILRPPHGVLEVNTVGWRLYDGVAGIAIFLAAFCKVSNDAHYGRLALDALNPICKRLQNVKQCRHMADELGIGGGEGIASVIYALTVISRLLGTTELLEDALLATKEIDESRIKADRVLDVIAGSAGAILGLVTLYDATGNPNTLERAYQCGCHLLEKAETVSKDCLAWHTGGSRPLTGFSHGAAGITYALLRLYERTGDASIRQAVQKGIAYERSLFLPEHGNWPDLRNANTSCDEVSCMTSWCHGAPGIGIARLGVLSLLKDAQLHLEIETAVKTTLDFGVGVLDNLCCGNFGRLETFLVAGSRLNRPDLVVTARRTANQLVKRAVQNGSFAVEPSHPYNTIAPGLFSGLAGIGYQLIRLAHPEQFPSVLLWE